MGLPTERRREMREPGAPGWATRTGTDTRAGPLPDGGFEAPFFEQVVEEVGVGVAVYDETGRFTYANEAYAELLDEAVAGLRGTPIWEVNPSVEADRFEEYWDSFETGETRRRKTVHRRTDGTTVPVETHTTAIESDGRTVHVGTITDITEGVVGWRALDRQDEQVEEFASVLSHDLRNPLNVAMGRIQLLAEDCDSEHIGKVEQSLDRMEELIDDALTLARQGTQLADTGPVALADVVQSTWRATTGDDAGLSVVDSLGVVQSDRSRLEVLFENLFRNAVEHASTASADATGEPGPGVSVRVGSLETGDGFFVEDDGPGIDPGERAEVFEFGYTTETDGTGFGLSIVRTVARTHGWTVELGEGTAGGARFEFTGVEFE